MKTTVLDIEFTRALTMQTGSDTGDLPNSVFLTIGECCIELDKAEFLQAVAALATMDESQILASADWSQVSRWAA